MITGRQILVDTQANLEADGFWKVELVVTQKRKEDEKDWESKSTSVKSYDRDMDRAVATVNASMARFMAACMYDLFSEEDGKASSLKTKTS